MDHVVIFAPGQIAARDRRPVVTCAVEARDRPGPAFKHGVGSGDTVWIRMGPLLVARATVDIAWHGEYGSVRELRERTRGTELYEMDSFWARKPKVGYAVVARLRDARFLGEPKLAGPRSYGYDWIVLESDRKRAIWLDGRAPEERDRGLVELFRRMTA